jgi:hypothetical protein
MKLSQYKSQPDIQLNDGTTASHSTAQTNMGTMIHCLQWPRKERRDPLELTEEEYAAWLLENAATSEQGV